MYDILFFQLFYLVILNKNGEISQITPSKRNRSTDITISTSSYGKKPSIQSFEEFPFKLKNNLSIHIFW
jgi:hypothetical protein